MAAFVLSVAENVTHPNARLDFFRPVANLQVAEIIERDGVVVTVVQLVGPFYLPFTWHIECLQGMCKRAKGTAIQRVVAG